LPEQTQAHEVGVVFDVSAGVGRVAFQACNGVCGTVVDQVPQLVGEDGEEFVVVVERIDQPAGDEDVTRPPTERRKVVIVEDADPDALPDRGVGEPGCEAFEPLLPGTR
jgi:hypothetical protein